MEEAFFRRFALLIKYLIAQGFDFGGHGRNIFSLFDEERGNPFPMGRLDLLGGRKFPADGVCDVRFAHRATHTIDFQRDLLHVFILVNFF